MKPELQKIFTKLSKEQTQRVDLSVIDDAKQVIREAGDEIDFVDQLQNEIMSKLQQINKLGADIKQSIKGLDNAKGYKSEITNAMKQIQKAASDLGADYQSIREWKLLDSSIDLINDLEADNKRIRQEAKKFIS